MTDEPLDITRLISTATERLHRAGIEVDGLTVRNIRYYTSEGLLPPPTARRGRTAVYGPVHVDRVVALKRLQAAGLRLAEIRPVLASADGPTLSAMADGDLPDMDELWSKVAGDDFGEAVEPTAYAYQVGPGVRLLVDRDATFERESIERVVSRTATLLGEHTEAAGPIFVQQGQSATSSGRSR